jgi:hypothetical protein
MGSPCLKKVFIPTILDTSLEVKLLEKLVKKVQKTFWRGLWGYPPDSKVPQKWGI